MESFILYFIKASALLAVFFLAYYFLLRKETFFTANRWFLLAGIITSLLLPKIIFVKTIWIEPVVATANYTPIETATTPLAFEAIPNAGEELVSPSFTEAENSVITTEPLMVDEPAFEINWLYVVAGVYLIGMFFFLGRFIRDFKALRKIIRNQAVELQGGFKFLDTDKIQSPFSFFKYIVYNSKRFKKEELENILEHEKVHSSQMHSADMIISQLFCVIFWFNPFAWLHKKAIAQNLEFIADSIALKAVPDRIIYQKTLLKVSAPHHCILITNHFFQSLIKKRIVMLNTDQSKKRNSWKYAIVLPLLTIFMIQFQVETVAQEKEDKPVQQQTNNYEVKVDKNSTDDYLKAQSKIFKNNHGIDLKFSRIKRNSDKEIVAIKTTYKNKNGNSGDSYLKGKEPIQPFVLSREEDKVVVTNVPSTYGSFNTPSVYGKFKNNPVTVTTTSKAGMPGMPIAPIPPIPPIMPNIPTLPNAPVLPQLPSPPTPPTTPYNENSADWKKFEEQIEKFEAEMDQKQGEIAKFEEAMEKFAAQIEAAYTKDVEKQMAEFDKKMMVYDKEMQVYAKQIEALMEKDARNR